MGIALNPIRECRTEPQHDNDRDKIGIASEPAPLTVPVRTAILC